MVQLFSFSIISCSVSDFLHISDAALTSFCMLFSSVDENVCDRFGNVSSVNPLFLEVCSHVEALSLT